MFQDVARLELQNKVLEITVWDYDRFKTNDFLGELIIELRGLFLYCKYEAQLNVSNMSYVCFICIRHMVDHCLH